MNRKNKATQAKEGQDSRLRDDYNRKVKELDRIKRKNEKLSEEIELLRRPRWLENLNRDFVRKNDVFRFAWYTLNKKELSEIVDASKLIEAFWKIEPDYVRHMFEVAKMTPEKEDGNRTGSVDGGVESMPLFWKLDALIKVFVECQWRIELAAAQKHELFLEAVGGKSALLNKFGGLEKIAKVRDVDCIDFVSGLRLIVKSNDYGSRFGLERSERFAAFPMPQPPIFPSEPSFCEVISSGSPSIISSAGTVVKGDAKERICLESDMSVLNVLQRKKDVFWRFFWYRYCEEMFFGWMFGSGGGGKSLVLTLSSRCSIEEKFEQKFEVNLENYSGVDEVMVRHVQWLFYILVKKGFRGGDLEEWFIAFQQWAENQKALGNARARKGDLVDEDD